MVVIFIRRCLVGMMLMLLIGGVSGIGFIVAASAVAIQYALGERAT
jgi:2-phosphoglycerate kinase